MDEIQNIDDQIRALHARRAELVKAKTTDAILDLTWLKNFYGRLQINPYGGCGIPTYSILIASATHQVPDCYESVTVMGNDRNYSRNITFKPKGMNEFAEFSTDNADLLCDFLRKVTFNKFEFPLKELEFLQTVRNIQLSKKAVI